MSASFLTELEDRLAREALHVVLPVTGAVLEPVTGRLLGESASASPWSAIVVGDGGGGFFARFLAASRAGEGPRDEENPLDGFTRRRVNAVVEAVLGRHGLASAVFFPFATERVHLPFQRVGQAAGLPPPGPLGVQVHPVYGPWWAYRALVAVAAPLAAAAPLAVSCPPCRGPCVNECEAHARSEGRWRDGVLLGPIVCGDACGARLRCPVGVGARYTAEQLAFHARARSAAAARRGA